MEDDEGPRSLRDVLAAAYGAVLVFVGLIIVAVLAVVGPDDGATSEASRGASGEVTPASGASGPVLRANPAPPVTTFYLVYSPQQATKILAIHERTVRASTSRQFTAMFAQAIALPVVTAEDSIVARDVIDRAYADYFAGKGPYVNIVDTANWCKDRSSVPSVFVGAPNELASAIAETCSAS